MDIKAYLKDKKISIREMSEVTRIPYSTLNDIVNNRVNLEECQYRTLKKIALFLNVSMDALVYEKEDFQTFRNKLHHEIKDTDSVEIVLEILETKKIDYYLMHHDNLKALYLLSLLDYFSNQNKIPLCAEYSELRMKKLEKPYYVGDKAQFETCDNCIDEFVKHNIYEGDLYDAV